MLSIAWSKSRKINFIVTSSVGDRKCLLRESWVGRRHGTVVANAFGGTRYPFGYNSHHAQQSYTCLCSRSTSKNFVGLCHAISVGIDVQGFGGNERDERNVGVKMTSRIFVLPRPRGSFLWMGPSCWKEIWNNSGWISLLLPYSSCRLLTQGPSPLHLVLCCQKLIFSS